MTRKIISLMLALVLLCSFAMTGCSKDGNEDNRNASADIEENPRLPLRLSLWLPTDESTTDEARALVSAEINKLTIAKYNTAIDLHLVPRDEYQETMDAKIEEVAIARAAKEANEELSDNGQTSAQEGFNTDVKYDIDNLDSYPAVASDQLDIFLVSGYDNYKRYIDEDTISQLNGELSSGSKILKQYIYPYFFDIADEFGIYGIPNNHPVGEYQYLLVNKELVERYDYDPDSFTSIARCRDFIIDMGNQNLEGLVPLLGPAPADGVNFWGINGDSEWSVLGSQYGSDVAYNVEVAPANILSNGAYTSLLRLLKQLDELGLVGDGELEEGEYFAVGVIPGKGDDIEKYRDDYYVSVHSSPVCSEDDVFGAMFCVSTYTKNLSRAMEIITYINTSEDIRTVLQYGIKGVHWDYENDAENTIKIISDEYGMNLLETGNVYMTYPGEGMTMDYWEYGKQQNLDSISSPFIKFDGYVTDENRECLERIAEYSKTVWERLDAATYEDFNSTVSELRSEIASNPDVKAMLDAENENSVYKIYVDWHSELYPF